MRFLDFFKTGEIKCVMLGPWMDDGTFPIRHFTKPKYIWKPITDWFYSQIYCQFRWFRTHGFAKWLWYMVILEERSRYWDLKRFVKGKFS